jgi:hypothetical protein
MLKMLHTKGIRTEAWFRLDKRVEVNPGPK